MKNEEGSQGEKKKANVDAVDEPAGLNIFEEILYNLTLYLSRKLKTLRGKAVDRPGDFHVLEIWYREGRVFSF